MPSEFPQAIFVVLIQHVQRTVVTGIHRLAVMATADIASGQEITINYGYRAGDVDAAVPCRCGATACTGIMGSGPRGGALPAASAPQQRQVAASRHEAVSAARQVECSNAAASAEARAGRLQRRREATELGEFL